MAWTRSFKLDWAALPDAVPLFAAADDDAGCFSLFATVWLRLSE
jgi:hypothetical protein